MSSRPIVCILCPKEFKFTDHDATVETPFLEDVATVKTVWLDYAAPFPAEICDAHVLIRTR